MKGPPAGVRNDVLVVGTTHLSGLPQTPTPAQLAPLLDRLAAWRPSAIATEDLSGLQCDGLRRYPARYAQTVEMYCADPGPAARATGLDVAAANAEAERLLAGWPQAPSPLNGGISQSSFWLRGSVDRRWCSGCGWPRRSDARAMA